MASTYIIYLNIMNLRIHIIFYRNRTGHSSWGAAANVSRCVNPACSLSILVLLVKSSVSTVSEIVHSWVSC